ncbi:Outer membrane protein D1 [Thiorhodovibrio winogradskyi]|uniref:Outer membrane protein D1 n=1 Tax=Thiorhodovibrio winogradskyi TaxID=77007 RepID=A0ABZ0SKS5_9GAMM|nr:carbohydrate porin [Thiorhodovibrio winogradskyi]
MMPHQSNVASVAFSSVLSLKTRAGFRWLVPPLIGAVLTIPSNVNASDFSSANVLTGDWGGARSAWQAHGVDIRLNYTTESLVNVAGGEKAGGTYADNIGLDVRFDLAKLLGVPSTQLLVKLSQRDGTSVSERFIAPSLGGNTFTAQEVAGTPNFKVVNVQFNTRLLDGRLDLAYGRLVANDDFLSSSLYCQFVNNAFCGSPKAVFLHNPFTFSAYPVATWGARLRYDTPARDWTVQLALYDGDPELKRGDARLASQNPHGTDWGLGDNGVTLAGELQYHRHRDSATALPGTYKLGGYYLTGDFDDLSVSHQAPAGDQVRGNAMLWLLGEQMLYRTSPDRHLSAFGSLVASLDDRVNQMSHYLNAGLVYRGLFRARPQDSTGFGLAVGWYGDPYNRGLQAAGQARKDHEAVIELNHRFALGHGIAIQPDLQYILRPGGTGDIDNALVIGAKISLDF